MRTCLFVMLLGVAAPASAQDLPDAGLPDGSVGMSGADRETEEAETQGGPCLSSRDCGQGFGCEGQRCVPTRPVTVGCDAAPQGLVVLGAVAALIRRRQR